MLGEAIKN
jgi:hypothetical protein